MPITIVVYKIISLIKTVVYFEKKREKERKVGGGQKSFLNMIIALHFNQKLNHLKISLLI